MTKSALEFGDQDSLGRVAGVDTHRISIAIDNPMLVTRVRVGDLIAISGTTAQDYLIAEAVEKLGPDADFGVCFS